MARSGFLTHLLDSGDVAGFVALDWGKDLHYWPRGLARLADGAIDLSCFETTIATLNRAHEGWLHFANQGLQAIPQEYVDAAGRLKMHEVAEAFAAGRTLYLTKAECVIAPLSRLCLALQSELADAHVAVREKINAHVFLTPRNSQGFAAHRDAHASFILQCEGRKHWKIYVPRQPFAEALHPGAVAPDVLAEHDATEITLEEGDILYMPEWWPHEARASEYHSLHVTLRIFPLRYADLMAKIAQHSAVLSASVGPDAMANLGAAFADLITGDTFREEVQESLPAALDRAVQQPEYERQTGLLSRVFMAEDINLDTLLVRNADLACDLRETPQSASLVFADTQVSGPRLFRPVFEFVFAHTEFRPSELPEIEAQYDRLDVSRRLLRGGLVNPDLG